MLRYITSLVISIMSLFTNERILLHQGRESFLYNAINMDFKATGKCNFELSSENLMELGLCWAAQKKSPTIPLFNYG